DEPTVQTITPGGQMSSVKPVVRSKGRPQVESPDRSPVALQQSVGGTEAANVALAKRQEIVLPSEGKPADAPTEQLETRSFRVDPQAFGQSLNLAWAGNEGAGGLGGGGGFGAEGRPISALAGDAVSGPKQVQTGDPEWTGILESPRANFGASTNRFVARYAYTSPPLTENAAIVPPATVPPPVAAEPSAPVVNVEAKLAELDHKDNNALGFDWYLGNSLKSDNRLGVQGGSPPSFTGQPGGRISNAATPGVPQTVAA